MNVFVVVLMSVWLYWEINFGDQCLAPIGFTLIFILIQLMKINRKLNETNDLQLIEKILK